MSMLSVPYSVPYIEDFEDFECYDASDLLQRIQADGSINTGDGHSLAWAGMGMGGSLDPRHHKPKPYVLHPALPEPVAELEIAPKPYVDELAADERPLALDAKWTEWQRRMPHSKGYSKGQYRYLDGVHYEGTECASFYWEEISPNKVHVHCTNSNCETHKRH